ncbi:MAG: hypothetical protein OXL96_11760 [Candidatus Poribacteria bacterium]|nr:hypothetical protein [Candidatus Poribacteria bacterium]
MLKDLFSNRLFIGALAFFILSVVGGTWYIWHVEQTEAVKLAETEEFRQWWQKRQEAGPPAVSEVPPSDAVSEADSPEAVVSVSTPSEDQQGDVPDFEFESLSAEEHQQIFESLSPEERQQIFDQFYLQHGLDPPPRGYKYRWKAIGVPLLDEDGNPVLQKEGEPWVEVKYGIGFAPTREEYERYQKLQDDQGWAESRGDFAEAERLTAEIEALEASVQRWRPLYTMADAIGAEAASKMDAAMDAKLNAALREYDLEHLISPY